MDKNALLIQLSERGRFWRMEFDELSPPEQVFRAIWDLESDVNNGGFDQYFRYSSGNTAFAVVAALKKIDAHEMAQIVADANSIFPGSDPPPDRAQRQKVLDSLTSDQKDSLESLDERFFLYPDDLTELLFEYVRQNAGQIYGAETVGIG